jgi:hypothetical protein
MKKIVLVIVSLVFAVLLLVSCNNSICPAYASGQDAGQVENNNI